MTDSRGDDVLAKIKPNQTWRLYYGKRDHRNRRIHIRAVVDEVAIVICEWSYRRKRWIHSIEDVWFFVYRIESGVLKMVKESE